MQKMKAMGKILIGLLLVLCLTGCGGESSEDTSSLQTTEAVGFIELAATTELTAAKLTTTAETTTAVTTTAATATVKATTTKVTAAKTTTVKTTNKKTTYRTTTKAAAKSSSGGMVWIPRTGSKYHSNSGCSKMKNPSQISRSEAESMGYEPCKICY